MSAGVSVQKSIMSFTQIKLHHSTPLLAYLTPHSADGVTTIRTSHVRMCVPFRNETFRSMCRAEDDDDERGDHDDDCDWVFGLLRNMRLVLLDDVTVVM